jgi:glycosyltransferase involved in cell wall biosynthesis
MGMAPTATSGAAPIARKATSERPVTVVITSCADPYTAGSVPQIGFQVARGISERTTATLIFHATDRELVSSWFPAEQLRFAGSRSLARSLRRVSMRLFSGKWNLISMIEFIDYALFDAHAYAIARRLTRRERVDYILRVNPISLLFPSLLPRLPAPVFTGPHNGGMEWPPGFRFLDRKEQTGQQFRFLGDLLHRAYGDIRRYRAIFVANEMCAASVPQEDRDKLVFFPENGVDGLKPSSVHAGDAKRLLFVGRLTPFKGVDFILRGLARLPEEVKLTIAGDGPQRPELEDLAGELGVRHRCRFLGQVPHAQLDAAYLEAGVFVFPSVRETGGAVVLEAMSHGLPCVVAGWGGPAAYTGQAGIHLRVDSPAVLQEDLVRTLSGLLENPEAGRTLGRKAKQVIRGEYVWDSKADRLHAAIVERMAAPGG